MMIGCKWILASASPRRRALLASLGLRLDVDPSRVTEPPRRPGEAPTDYAIRVARLKAREVSRRHRSGVIISADTIVVLGDTILGKPDSMEDGRKMLRRLGGRWHEVVSGVCLLEGGSGRMRSAATRSRVHFRRLTQEEIQWYLNTGEYCDKAGAYAIQGFASLFADRIEGCYFNIVGFPLAAFRKLCGQLGINLLGEIERTKPRRRQNSGVRSLNSEDGREKLSGMKRVELNFRNKPPAR